MAQQKIGKLFLLSSPSGGGKTTLANKVIEQLVPVYPISRVVTYTTRAPRATDKPGIDYHFLSHQEFTQKLEQRFFLESSTAYGHYYGTPSDIVQRAESGESFIAVVDRTGIYSIKQVYDAAVAIWLEVPDIGVLEQRLRTRATESEEQMQRRLQIAQQELIEEALNPMYGYRVMNDELQRALDKLLIIIKKEL